MTEPITETFARDSVDPSVLVVDGHGISLSVKRGELVIKDGMCGRGRVRTVSRSDRDIRRIVIIGQSGNISLDAMDWIHGLKLTPGERRRTDPISLVRVDTRGELVNASAQSMNDTKFHRTQTGMRNRSEGLDITKYLISEKIRGHARIIPEWYAEHWIGRLSDCTTLRQCRDTEAEEAKEYFRSWRLLTLKFSGPVRHGWTIFDSRMSPLNHNSNSKQASNRNAATPVNALLNYCYKVAKAETVLACYVAGIDPNLGILHSDDYPWSMALDIVETIRPHVDEYVLDLIDNRTFRSTDFAELDTGLVKVCMPLTSELSEQRLTWYRAVAPHVEHVRKLINGAVNGSKRTDATRITGHNRREGWENRYVAA